MAFAVASKGAPLAGLLKNLLLAAPSSSALRPASVAAGRRLSSTAGGAPFSIYEEFVSYHQLHKAMGTHPNSIFSTEMCRGWVSKQDENALQVKMEMPGVAAEHVKVWTYPKGLLVKGEQGDAAQAPGQGPTWYSGRIDLVPVDSVVVDKSQAEMKDGVLTVTVPRVKVDLGHSTEIKVRKAE